MFENLRNALRDLSSAAASPAQRTAAVAQMKQTLVQARTGLAEMAAAFEKTRGELASEEQELATVERRSAMAERIGDRETVEIAQRFAAKHQQRLDLLRRRLSVQEDELRVAEEEVATMTSEFMLAAKSGGMSIPVDDESAAAAAVEDVLAEDENLRRDLDSLARQRIREQRDAVADEKLAELKRRMQK
jgi:hypothetical protein